MFNDGWSGHEASSFKRSGSEGQIKLGGGRRSCNTRITRRVSRPACLGHGRFWEDEVRHPHESDVGTVSGSVGEELLPKRIASLVVCKVQKVDLDRNGPLRFLLLLGELPYWHVQDCVELPLVRDKGDIGTPTTGWRWNDRRGNTRYEQGNW